jgi:Tol biopolymer transport system component
MISHASHRVAACGAVPAAVVAFAMSIAVSPGLFASSGLTTLVSVSTGEAPGTGSSGVGNITADGRYVVFFSTSMALAPQDTDMMFDVFVRDLLTRTTTLESVSTDGTKGTGASSWPFITDDGRYITFQSDARNLVAGGTSGVQHIYVRDRDARTTELVSISTDGVHADRISDIGNISGDGRYVVFVSYASNLVPRDTNGSPDVFMRDRLTATTTRVSVSSQGQEGNGSSFWPRISADGRFVAFVSVATNLTGGDANGTVEDIFVRDLQTGTTELVSVSTAGIQGNSVSTMPSLSPDGRLLLFTSFAKNLVDDDTNGFWDVFARDLQTGVTERVSVSTGGNQGNHDSARASMSPDGRFVSFESLASTMVAGDANQSLDVFRRDRLAGTTDLVSISSTGQQGNANSGHAAISADGSRVVFMSSASNLVSGDVNGRLDVFLREAITP